MVVVPTVQRRQFGDRGPAKFAAPQHQRTVEEAAPLQVGEERGDGFVPLAGQLFVRPFEAVVVVPRLPGSAPHLHEPYPALDQSARVEQLPAVRRVAVQLADLLRFPGQVKSVGRLGLHPERQLEGSYSGF
jgi:hypothetical protein